MFEKPGNSLFLSESRQLFLNYGCLLQLEWLIVLHLLSGLTRFAFSFDPAWHMLFHLPKQFGILHIPVWCGMLWLSIQLA